MIMTARLWSKELLLQVLTFYQLNIHILTIIFLKYILIWPDIFKGIIFTSLPLLVLNTMEQQVRSNIIIKM